MFSHFSNPYLLRNPYGTNLSDHIVPPMVKITSFQLDGNDLIFKKKLREPVFAEELDMSIPFSADAVLPDILKNLVLAHFRENETLNIKKVFDIKFTNYVMNQMSKFYFNRIFRLQAIAWPYILRGNSIFIVSQPKTGRTWSYIPAICSAVQKSFFCQLTLDRGPMALIIVPTAKKAIYTAKACNEMLPAFSKYCKSIALYYADEMHREVCFMAYNGSPIIICTPMQLLRLHNQHKKRQIFDMHHLKYIIMDDVEQYPKKIVKLLYDEFVRDYNKQLIMISKIWLPNIMSEFIRQAKNSLLLFGDFLEALAYANIVINMETCDSIMGRVTRILKCKNELKGDRMVIYCGNDKETDILSGALESMGRKTLVIKNPTDFNSAKEVFEWKTTETNKILILCDNVMNMHITNANCCITYTLPTSWVQLKMRFVSISKNIRNMIKNTYSWKEDDSIIDPKVILFINATENATLPRLLDILKKHYKSIPEEFEKIASIQNHIREIYRIAKNRPICMSLLSFAVCNEIECAQRHTFGKIDLADNKGDPKYYIPEEGIVRVKIIKMYSPIHYAIQLLAYNLKRDANSKWIEVDYLKDLSLFRLNMYLHFAANHKRIPYGLPKKDDIAVYLTNERMDRVRIISETTHRNAGFYNNATYMYVEVMDTCTDIIPVFLKDLHKCPDNFKKYPPMALNLRISCGLRPNNTTLEWEPRHVHDLVKLLDNAQNDDNCELHAKVNFRLKHTIFVENLCIVKQNRNKGIINDIVQMATKHSTYNTIIDNKIATKLKLLYDNCCAAAKIPNTTKIEGVDANLIKLIKNMPCISADEDKIKMSVDLVPQTLKEPLPTEPVLETWAKMPIATIMRINLAYKEANGNWDGIRIIGEEKAHTKRFSQLEELIDSVIVKLKDQLTYTDLVKDIKHEKICTYLANFNDENGFVRVKLTIIHNEVCNFFSVDYGYYLKVKRRSLYNIEIYRCPNIVLTFMPFQTMFCTLHGIEMLENQTTNLKCKYKLDDNIVIYGVALQEYSHEKRIDKLLNNYEIVMYICDEEEKFNDALLFNKELVAKGFAKLKSKRLSVLENCGIWSPYERRDFVDVGTMPLRDALDKVNKITCEKDFYEQHSDSHPISDNKIEKKNIQIKNFDDINYDDDSDDYVDFEDAEDNNNIQEDNINVEAHGFDLNKLTQYLSCLDDKDDNPKAVEEKLNYINSYLGDLGLECVKVPASINADTPMTTTTSAANAYDDNKNGITSSPLTTSKASTTNLTATTTAIVKPQSETEALFADNNTAPIISPAAGATAHPVAGASTEPIAATIMDANSINKNMLAARLISKRQHYSAPYVTWFQTTESLTFKIEANGITSYDIKVIGSHFWYTAQTEGNDNEKSVKSFCFTLLGSISPHISHTFFGLNVTVKILKIDTGIWPKLLKNERKLNWLQYNKDHLIDDETNLVTLQQLHNKNFHISPSLVEGNETMIYVDESSSDEEVDNNLEIDSDSDSDGDAEPYLFNAEQQ